MGRSYLGEFEELVLVTVASRKGEAGGAAIPYGIQQKTGPMVVLSAVQVALYRLEEKGRAPHPVAVPAQGFNLS
jgi:PadR family transcriptional regulator, regulatory protein PadR